MNITLLLKIMLAYEGNATFWTYHNQACKLQPSSSDDIIGSMVLPYFTYFHYLSFTQKFIANNIFLPSKRHRRSEGNAALIKWKEKDKICHPFEFIHSSHCHNDCIMFFWIDTITMSRLSSLISFWLHISKNHQHGGGICQEVAQD